MRAKLNSGFNTHFLTGCWKLSWHRFLVTLPIPLLMPLCVALTRCIPYEPAPIHVEVIYALPESQPLFRVELAEGATVNDAIRASGVLDAFPYIDLLKTRSEFSASWSNWMTACATRTGWKFTGRLLPTRRRYGVNVLMRASYQERRGTQPVKAAEAPDAGKPRGR